MDKRFTYLFTPWKIHDVQIKNRIVLCPMGGTSLFGWMEKSKFSNDAADFFLERAKNNVGLIIPGVSPIRDVMGGQWLYKNPKMFDELKKFMDAIHRTGSRLFVQLSAGFGRSFSLPESLRKTAKSKILSSVIKPKIDLSRLMASPSELPSRWAPDVKCRALTADEIREIEYAFAETAFMCMNAGVDGVEIHAVHEGYLLDQFTTEYTNHRLDEYGGSFENRYRFATNIVKQIKKRCGFDYPVSLRYSVVSKTKGFDKGAVPGEMYTEVGRDMAESERAIRYLQDAGYDMFDCDNGTYDAWYWAHPPAYMPFNCNLNEVAHIKQFTTMPVVCAGRMDPEVAARAIAEGKIDAMGVARQFLTDPAWVTKLEHDNIADIQPCICCHNGCLNLAHYKGVACDVSMDDSKHMSRCALNPMTMQGHKFDIITTKSPKKVAVIGGGIGGMEAARIASLRGHRVTLFEKTNMLGGVFIAAAAPLFKEKDRQLLDWYRRRMASSKVQIMLNTEVRSIEALGADEVIVATGATPKKLKIPGINRAIDSVDYLRGHPVGDVVVIMGGGLTGCEIAFDLDLRGKHPVIIELKNDLMSVSGLSMANSSFLRDYFEFKQIPILLESRVTEIKANSVIVETPSGKREIRADSVISSVGYNPAPIAKPASNVHLVGDCEQVGNLRTVIWGAWEVAESI